MCSNRKLVRAIVKLPSTLVSAPKTVAQKTILKDVRHFSDNREIRVNGIVPCAEGDREAWLFAQGLQAGAGVVEEDGGFRGELL